LAICNRSREADHCSSFKNQNGLRLFREEFPLGAGVAGSRARRHYWGFECDRLLDPLLFGAQCPDRTKT